MSLALNINYEFLVSETSLVSELLIVLHSACGHLMLVSCPDRRSSPRVKRARGGTTSTTNCLITRFSTDTDCSRATTNPGGVFT